MPDFFDSLKEKTEDADLRQLTEKAFKFFLSE
jgi:hypothetical protein